MSTALLRPFVTHMTEKHFANVGEDVVKSANPLADSEPNGISGCRRIPCFRGFDFVTGAIIPVDGGSHAYA